MASNLEAEVRGFLRLAQVPAAEIEVESCNPGDPNRTDDDSCVLTMTDSLDAEPTRKEVRVDDVFSFINTWNLSRGNSPGLDPRNYFFRLDPNAVFFRRGSASGSDLADGGLLYRTPGGTEWRNLSFKDVQSSAELRSAIVPILSRIASSNDGYRRLNTNPRHQSDEAYAYAQAKAVLWLINLTPTGDASARQALLQGFPTMNADAAQAAFLRLKEEGGEAVRRLVPILVDWMSDPARRDMANRMLAEIAPSISPEDRSNRTVVRPSFSWELSGSVSVPWNGVPVGTYAAADIGVQTCIGRAFKCAQGEGFRLGAAGEIGRMVNGFGYVFFGGKVFAGNENLMGFVDGGANWYPTGGTPGDLSWTPVMGGGVKIVPALSFPLGLKVGLRVNPTHPRDGALLAGLGIGQ